MTDASAAEAGNDDAGNVLKRDAAPSKHIPWQFEWKHPEWIVASETENKRDPNETDQCQIVGIASAKLSSSQVSKILSHGNSKGLSDSEIANHYLLIVSLLGLPVDDTERDNTKEPSQALASEVLLEVLEVASDESSEGRTIRSKRLRWPESIFDEAPKETPSASKRHHRQRTKRKNLLEKVFLPLMGIDEEDEFGHQKATSRLPKQQPTIGIVSATLCRRPTESMLENSKNVATKDIVELISFSNRGATNNAATPIQTNEETERNDLAMTETMTQSQPSTKQPFCGELSFACVSQAGQVFVYDPIKLLLGISGQDNDDARNLEEASNFFFGKELFQNLQETWKPLAEPTTRIHLSIFEHDQKAYQKPAPVEPRLVQSNQELVTLAQKQASRDNQSTGSSQQDSHHIGSEHSVQSNESSIATDAMTVVQTMAIQLQSNVDEALSVLPYLLNPLLEPATLKDRTVQNRPHAIATSGKSYLVVTGSGVKKKDLPKIASKPHITGNASVSIQSHGDTVSSRGGPQMLDEVDKVGAEEALSSPQEVNISVDGNRELEPASTKNDEWWEEDASLEDQKDTFGSNAVEHSSQVKSIEERNIESATETHDGGNDSAADNQEVAGETDTNSTAENGEDNDGDKEQEVENEINAETAVENGEEGSDGASVNQEESIQGSEDSSKNGLSDEDEENSQRHYFDGYDNAPGKDHWKDRGGFVTFLSTGRWSETRTLFLPFVPIRTSHISKWNGMELLWVIGEYESVLIRMDSSGPVPVRIGDIVFGGEILDHENDILQSGTISNNSNGGGRIGNGSELSPLSVKRFQVLPIELGTSSDIAPRLLCSSDTGIDPPSILELHIDRQRHQSQLNEANISKYESSRCEQALVLLKTLGYCTPQGTVVLRHAPSHVAKLNIDRDMALATINSSSNERSILAEHGQGWSLLGINGHMHFICWEGSTLLHGAYAQELQYSMDSVLFQSLHSTPILSISMTQDAPSKPISSSQNNLKGLEDEIERDDGVENSQSFSSHLNNLPSVARFQEGGDVYTPYDASSSDLLGSSIGTGLSRRENSEYLLQRCSSWSKLDNTSSDGVLLDRQEPILCLRSGKAGSPHSMLSLRQLVVENGKHSSFEQVLAWLAKRKNFFVAAGIALDLLQDGDSLYHLWKNAEMIDEEDEEIKLFGLLDGIAPIRLLENNQTAKKHKHSVTATHLSDMTVGCFIKGGASMAKTLERFLQFNESYDAARVSLMLSLTTIDLFSKISIRSNMAETSPQDVEVFEELLWPIKCLLSIGTEREYLQEVLTLLNNTIPDELRNRYSEEEKEEDEAPKPSLALTKMLIQLILESDALALEVLMSFVDGQSQTSFWQSLDRSTRLALSLMETDSSFPFLRHPDVRAWAREEIDISFQGQSNLPTQWLQELSFACLQNANCNLGDLTLIGNNDDVDDAASDRISKLKLEIETTRNALIQSTDNGYQIDYDLLVPALLLLKDRDAYWLPSSRLATSTAQISATEDSYVSTQSLLNAACYLAGRSPSTGDSLTFLFDGKSAMKQCYQVKNVVAGAYLIGGKNGFILHVSDVLNQGIGISIPDAEAFLLNDQLDLKIIEESKVDGDSFKLTSGHQTLLLLLEEHVLGIKTFGDFNVAHTRGKVDPVFAARSILRAWLSLSLGDKTSASRWLGKWLEDRLGISVQANSWTPRSQNKAKHPEKKQDSLPSSHRLACATLARSLLWPNNQTTFVDDNQSVSSEDSLPVDNTPLASTMGFEKKLLIELCQSCLGLVESVPPSIVREIQI